MFQTYEEDFGRLLNSLQKKIALAPNLGKDIWESAISEGAKELQEAEKCLRQMEIEISMMQSSSRVSSSSQVRRYREDFEEVRRNFRKEEAKFTEQKSRETLMGASLDNGFGNQREKLIQREGNIMSQQIMKLEQGKKAALEAESAAIESMNQLKGQRDVLERVIVNNREIGDNLSQGHRIINSITRRNIQNKLILFGIAIILIGAIVFLVYIKLS
ncbi:hypothetical protein SteCoe_13209 [Stentor coeruleus]|uniref:Vesicle transport v-SNARE N-terminal domain-containing protein n=1 Tax=Stentor coeruleus TaxID=5963 RepID=A0A1R2C8Y8_9CILI|nr:hypothetical protein SteCoe_13209 [Stentor coeruleus]